MEEESPVMPPVFEGLMDEADFETGQEEADGVADSDLLDKDEMEEKDRG